MRRIGLKKGLRQLTIEQLKRVIYYPKEMVLDEFNYHEGKFCPLAVAVGLDCMEDPSDEKVVQALTEMNYEIFNTRGIEGDFYTTDRKKDLIEAASEVLIEKQKELYLPKFTTYGK